MPVDAIAATGLALTAIQTIFAALQCKELRDMCSLFGYDSQLAELEGTVATIKAVLLDAAESKQQELTHEGRVWVEKLKDAVYNVDDLLDEFNTMAQQWNRNKGAKKSKKVRRFFSRSNKLLVAFEISNAIKKVRRELDSIAKDRTQFGFGDVYAPIKSREQTSSYVYEERIIGREADKEKIISLLLQDPVTSTNDRQENVSFVTVVGMGGLGKTTLAQLVYNDDRIQSAFELRLWICVSEEFGMKEILGKMLMSATQEKFDDFDVLHKKVREQIEGKKYLLVLDDVWEESHSRWVELRDFLIRGGKGSRVLVTSRSKEVARVIGNDSVYELQGLSDEDSWELFKNMAFEQGREGDVDLVSIGKEVVKRCCRVPLAIRFVGSLLYGQDKSKWLSFKSVDLGKMGSGKDSIMSILKFSYYHLTPQLKSCFSFGALFPKDFVMKKEVLLDLWLAHGCIDQINDDRSVEDVAEEYFSILVQRCFLQDAQINEYGEIGECKMHDLVHDLALEVAGKESLMLDSGASHLIQKLYHLSIDEKCMIFSNPIDGMGNLKPLRTFLLNNSYHGPKFVSESNVDLVLSKFKRLRYLDLKCSSIRTLPSSVGKLLHLRQLNLSDNRDIETLPKSVTKLYNLQVLKLRDCCSLRHLPEDLRELVHLRHLDTHGCSALTHMPAGMYSLTRLQKLSVFVVNDKGIDQVQKGQLKDLKALGNLRGELEIRIKACLSYNGAKCLDKTYLNSVSIRWEEEDNNSGDEAVVHETLLEGLQPPGDVKKIVITGYKSSRLPAWAASLTTSFPCLVKITLRSFDKVQHLPCLSQLPNLKVLFLWNMLELEFIEGDIGGLTTTDTSSTFFPSLEELTLRYMPKLKGWWRGEAKAGGMGNLNQTVIPCFPRLHQLEIWNCRRMTLFPPCLRVKKLTLRKCNKRLKFEIGQERVASPAAINALTSSNLAACGGSSDIIAVELVIDDASWLSNSLLWESVPKISALSIVSSEEESLAAAVEAFRMYASSLVELSIEHCRNLKSLIGGGLEHLTNLRTLKICGCVNLELGGDGDEGMPWKSLHSLSSLTLVYLTKVETLPRGFQYLTSLETLTISFLDNLKALPEWLPCLSSLRYLFIFCCPKLSSLPEEMCRLTSLSTLQIRGCEGLTARCREPDGEDFPKIRHISNIILTDSFF